MTQANNSKKETEIAEAIERAKLDIMAWRTDETSKGNSATVTNEQIKTILTGKDYVASLDKTSFTTKEGHTILYTELYTTQPPTPPSEDKIVTVAPTTAVVEKNTKYQDAESGNKIAVIPAGFAVVPGCTKIDNGLVISDVANDTTNLGNQFVWIPVSDDLEIIAELTTESDNQSWLDENYGEGTFNYEVDFNYEEEYEQMVTSVNNYNGFYIGRYETTIDEEENIGTKYNKEVLIIAKSNYNVSSSLLKCQHAWFDLYYKQKNANIIGNGESVQTSMIYEVLWNKTMEFIRVQKENGNTEYDVDIATSDWHNNSNPMNSAQANGEDVALNIWDLESNVMEWTQGVSSNGRVAFGGACDGIYFEDCETYAASVSRAMHPSSVGITSREPGSSDSIYVVPMGSRMILTIK